MGAQNWVETLDTIIADGTLVSNSTTETIVCPDFNFPAFYMQPGRTLRVWASGIMGNNGAANGTVTFRLRWGGVAGVVLGATNMLNLHTTTQSSLTFALQAMVVCRSAGSSGTATCGGNLELQNLLQNATNELPTTIPGSLTSLSTIDTTTAKLLSVTVKFDSASTNTNLTCQQRIIEVLN